MPPNKNNELAVLLGNGVSIAANPNLTIPALTRVIRTRFEEIDPAREAPDRVLARLAKRGKESGDPNKDFEAMIGPLDQQKDNLTDLRALAEIVGQESRAVRSAIRTISSFVQSLSRLGKGHALDIIARESIARWGGYRAVVDQFMAAVVDSVPGRITIGNLNYDALGLAGLLNATNDACDMARGDRGDWFDLLGDGQKVFGAPLRATAHEFPARRVRLVHPHGSLAWLRDPDTGTVYKFEVSDLRNLDFWAAWRDGETEWEPQVVLTNQSAKSTVVAQEPFNVSYDALRARLRTADRWLIAGYSFRDECVNDLLAAAWEDRKDVPDVLVVTMGAEPTVKTVLDAVGYNPVTDPDPKGWLRTCRHGVAAAPACRTWTRWAAQARAAAS